MSCRRNADERYGKREDEKTLSAKGEVGGGREGGKDVLATKRKNSAADEIITQ